jgi:hypothetical protein
MDKVYLIQINMADTGRNPEWEPVRAYHTLADAQAHVEWMLGEHGEEIEYRVEPLELYK